MKSTLNQLRTDLHALKTEYNHLDNDTDKKEAQTKINEIVKHSIIHIRQYLAENPVNKENIAELQMLCSELNNDTRISSNIGLSKLNHIIMNLSISNEERAYFQTLPNLKDKTSIILNKFKNFFIGRIKHKINKQIFFIWNQKLRFQATQQSIIKLNKKIAGYEAQIQRKPDDPKVQLQLNRARTRLTSAESFVREYQNNLESAAITRKNLEVIGGTHIALKTKDNAVLDGMYLSSQNFQQKCLEAGAQHAELSISIDGKQSVMTGLVLPKEKNADAFMKSLEQLKLFNNFSPDSKNKGAGWAKIELEDQILILPDFEVKRLLEKKSLDDNNYNYSFSEDFKNQLNLTIKPFEINPNPTGTVVMGMGAAGVYEMAKRETIALLMQGTNVMLFNHRGQGESTGKPSERGSYEDFKTVYQYLTQIHHIEDHQLFLRGLCLSGGSVSKLAASHPKVNVILDQTYAEFKDLALNTVLESIKDILDYRPDEESAIKRIVLNFLTPILKLATTLFSPNFKTVKHLDKHKGKLLILTSTEDSYITEEMSDKMVLHIANNATAERASQIRIGRMPGVHGTNWLDAKKNYGENQNIDLGIYHIMSFLKESNALTTFIDRGHTVNKLAKQYDKYLNSQAAINAIRAGIEQLPENIEDLPDHFMKIPLDALRRAKIKETNTIILGEVIEGKYHFDKVLNELDRLKDKLGESPVFGSSPPTLDDKDNGKVFLGIPVAAVKDWFRMVLEKEWKPQIFWRGAAKIFKVKLNNKKSQYEEAHLRIQRFGMLIANKERFFEILKEQDSDRYPEFGLITGLAWHANKNGPGTEKLYIEFLEQFLTENFEAAKNKGDDALIEYFNAFQGVCFEDRMQHLENYIKELSEDIKDVLQVIENIADLDYSEPVQKVFEKIFSHLGSKLALEKQTVTINLLLEEINKYDVFNREFPVEDDKKAKPTLTDFHEFALMMIEADVLDPYSYEDFLKTEFEIFKNSGKELNEENFRAQLQKRDGANQGEFDPNSPLINGFIQKHIYFN